MNYALAILEFQITEDLRKNMTATNVEIQTAALLVTLWISYGNPVRIKHSGYLFEFYLSILLLL